jgi:hypothetical protein
MVIAMNQSAAGDADDADQRRPFAQAADQRPKPRQRDRHHPGRAHGHRGPAPEGDPVAEEHEAEHRRLDHLGLGIGDADREVAEAEDMDEAGGGDDLRHRAQHRPADEG